MEPLTIMLFAFGLLTTNSIDLVFDEDDSTLLDGFVYIDDKIIELDVWQTTINPNRYFGYTTDGDSFYMLISDQTVIMKIWADTKIRIIEPII